MNFKVKKDEYIAYYTHTTPTPSMITFKIKKIIKFCIST